jgi:pantoate--beta-alanine ligase
MYGPNHVTYVDPTVSVIESASHGERWKHGRALKRVGFLQGFDDTAEGASRPGHFRGVATVVTKLFNIVQPTNAYFGQKDAAQCCLIRRIVHDLDIDVNVMVLDTVREPDGLAMSSRNAYLSSREREAAPIVYRSLRRARELYFSKSESISSDMLRAEVHRVLESEPLITQVQYVTIDDRETMRPIAKVGQEGAVISLACKLGSVRLIDNMVLKPR